MGNQAGRNTRYPNLMPGPFFEEAIQFSTYNRVSVNLWLKFLAAVLVHEVGRHKVLPIREMRRHLRLLNNCIPLAHYPGRFAFIRFFSPGIGRIGTPHGPCALHRRRPFRGNKKEKATTNATFVAFFFFSTSRNTLFAFSLMRDCNHVRKIAEGTPLTGLTPQESRPRQRKRSQSA